MPWRPASFSCLQVRSGDQSKAIFVQRDGPEACPVHASLADLLQDREWLLWGTVFRADSTGQARVSLNEPQDDGGHASLALLRQNA